MKAGRLPLCPACALTCCTSRHCAPSGTHGGGAPPKKAVMSERSGSHAWLLDPLATAASREADEGGELPKP